LTLLAESPGRLLERRGNAPTRGMIARRVDRKIGSLDKTRLIGELPILAFRFTFLCHA